MSVSLQKIFLLLFLDPSRKWDLTNMTVDVLMQNMTHRLLCWVVHSWQDQWEVMGPSIRKPDIEGVLGPWLASQDRSTTLLHIHASCDISLRLKYKAKYLWPDTSGGVSQNSCCFSLLSCISQVSCYKYREQADIKVWEFGVWLREVCFLPSHNINVFL